MSTIIKSDNPSARKPYTVRCRYGEDVNLTVARQRFTDAVEAWLDTVACSDRSRYVYQCNYRANILPAYGHVSVKEAASNRVVAETLLNVVMIGKSIGTRRMTRQILTGVLDSLVAHGTIASHRLEGIGLAEKTVSEEEHAADYVVLTDHEVSELAAICGQWVTVQRALGLRVNEVLGLRKSDFDCVKTPSSASIPSGSLTTYALRALRHPHRSSTWRLTALSLSHRMISELS